ncbi:hypothetical protein RvY_15999-2 [Ramazzottius varieornatus]|uniref:Uncharacterized protein n=1 Tax=Ramazzottius varieornatus TaxID=947166 RepID=A0A1D1W1G2_RAMVA|nr:hypothetical protein RvY_15999-2 [Ramazzottius varieornatus]
MKLRFKPRMISFLLRSNSFPQEAFKHLQDHASSAGTDCIELGRVGAQRPQSSSDGSGWSGGQAFGHCRKEGHLPQVGSPAPRQELLGCTPERWAGSTVQHKIYGKIHVQ